jgi:hypothetical protein
VRQNENIKQNLGYKVWQKTKHSKKDHQYKMVMFAIQNLGKNASVFIVYRNKTIKMRAKIGSTDWNFVYLLEVNILGEQNKQYCETYGKNNNNNKFNVFRCIRIWNNETLNDLNVECLKFTCHCTCIHLSDMI